MLKINHKKNISMSKSTTGYTLIEIIVVIGIMASLTAIIYSSFDGSKANSRDQQRVADISAIQLALEQSFNKNGVYPIDLEALTIKPQNATNPFISSIPKDPSTGKKYSDPTSTNSGYFPMSKSSISKDCISYQLWTTFERNNIYIDQKKGFNATDYQLPNNLYECTDTMATPPIIHKKINASATVSPLVYDVMP
ncbi:MAG: prepilin-type N-terminal cleavage/methylation domain-containing protein [Candidatus Paceibacterota bacterium]|jgi:prepilin-type N-terminal cleavage/methylation domain-containing protein